MIRRRWGLDDVRLHDLRRTCASWLSIEGENLPTVQNVLNHRSLAPTSIYARLNTKAVDRALQKQADQFCSLLNNPIMEVLEAPPSVKTAPEGHTLLINPEASAVRTDEPVEAEPDESEWPG
jgi:hypothetical protein